MNTTVKHLVAVAAVLIAAVAAYAGYIYARAYADSIQPSSFRNFTVSGEGKVTAVPDVAQFSFSVIGQGGKDLTIAQRQTTEKMNDIIAFMKSKGVDQKDIQTQQFGVEPRYQYYDCSRVIVTSGGGNARPCPPPEIVGYTVTQGAVIKVRDFTAIGDILSGVAQKGGSSISQLQFTIDDPVKLENEAREKAIKQAQEKAAALARAGGFTIGKLLTIEEGGSQPIPRYMNAGIGGVSKSVSLEAAMPSPTIEPGSQEVDITVSMRYEIK